MWAQILNILLGLWLMVAPYILGYGPAASDNGHIVGPTITTFSVIALWEATDGIRKWNYPFAFWLLLSPWILGYDNMLATGCDMLVGILVIIFSSVSQKIENRYGGGWASLWKKNPEHMERREKEI